MDIDVEMLSRLALCCHKLPSLSLSLMRAEGLDVGERPVERELRSSVWSVCVCVPLAESSLVNDVGLLRFGESHVARARVGGISSAVPTISAAPHLPT